MRPRVCLVASSEMTVRAFLAPQMAAMEERYDLTVVANTRNPHLLAELGRRARLCPVSIVRPISPLRDLAACLSLVRLMRRERFQVVHSMTPKAGLLAMLAARIAGIPVRIHTFTGQVWATRTGAGRAALKALDRLTARCTTLALTDSHSQREFLVREGVASAQDLRVLGQGSVGGVDLRRFRPDTGVRARVRERLGIPGEAVVLLFLGRLTRDKGVLDLTDAFGLLADDLPDVHLLVAGPDEEDLRTVMQQSCARHRARLHLLDFTTEPEQLMAASDVLCLPSYREGFGSVVIEAAAAGLPAVASRIYGVVDAVVEGRTGLLHAPGDVAALTEQLRRVACDEPLRRRLGVAAKERAQRDFSQTALIAAMLELLDSLAAPVCGARLAGGPQACRPSTPTCPGWYRRHGKRALDLGLALVAAVVLAPVAAIVALAVRMGLGSPVLFRQERPGRQGQPFVLVKFRSMTSERDEHGRLLPDAERLPWLGRWLRGTSLDEMPELWNVIAGDMSFVGPRPLLMEYLPRYTPAQARRHEVRPGITGLAQVSGRNALSWPERFALDVEYVDRCSLRLDLAILGRTLVAVFLRRGITQPGRATVDYFEGSAVDG
ncbi:MAG TPA: sugar transferase [Vicinamibacterales bacterium]|nr:sugar transferase [Vicinamibacterales bacterium]